MQSYRRSQRRKRQILGTQSGAQVSLPEPASPAFEAYITTCNPLGNAVMCIAVLKQTPTSVLMSIHVPLSIVWGLPVAIWSWKWHNTSCQAGD